MMSKQSMVDRVAWRMAEAGLYNEGDMDAAVAQWRRANAEGFAVDDNSDRPGWITRHDGVSLSDEAFEAAVKQAASNLDTLLGR